MKKLVKFRMVLFLIACLGLLLLSVQAQDPNVPPPPPPLWSGSFGAGLALTGGNSDTTSYNIAFDMLRDPNTRNIMKASGLYLRGDSNGEAIVDRLSLGFRDEYTLSERTFLYGDLAYLRDKFKRIDYLFAPSGGVGYKVYNTERLLFSLQGGVGAVWEKNPGFDVNSSGAVTAGQDLSWKLSEAARIVQNFTALWKTEEFEDALYHFGLGLATSITKNSELKVEFRDDFKNLPATPETKKNDTAFVTTFLFKF